LELQQKPENTSTSIDAGNGQMVTCGNATTNLFEELKVADVPKQWTRQITSCASMIKFFMFSDELNDGSEITLVVNCIAVDSNIPLAHIINVDITTTNVTAIKLRIFPLSPGRFEGKYTIPVIIRRI
jgi:hypothetical protein